MAQNIFTWIPFYKEFAEKLLQYKNDRKILLDFIYTLDVKYTSYLHEENNKRMDDICPFTVMGIFNRGTTYENRIIVAEEFKTFLDIKSPTPTNFEGIPVLNNQKSHFFGFKIHRNADDIENLWTLFEKVIKDGYDIEGIFDKVITQFIINVNITMGLYWIKPDMFLALDSQNRQYLKQYNINVKPKVPQFKDYYALIEEILYKMKTNVIKESSFSEFSYNAWKFGTNNGKIMEDPYFEYWEEVINTLHFKKNIILYGAPGTGKTYDVPEIAVRLNYGLKINPERSALMVDYKKLVDEKRIMFTTFHPSMDYEEFVEGLKPEIENGQISYNPTSGIFKNLCEDAEKPQVLDVNLGLNDNPTIWKVSLMGTYDNYIRKDCLENDRIRIGWDNYGATLTEDTKFDDGGRIVLDAFINKMQIGDIIFSCYTNRLIDAIGVVIGDYEYDSTLGEYMRVRKVKWLVKNIQEDIFDMNNQTVMTLSTVYRLSNISLEKVFTLLEKYKFATTNKIIKNTKPYILVIDEINRANISKVFGELITLLEPDKREGEINEVKLKLPYSKKDFTVPANVYIIATMNTADRSLGYIDYAVRRRFAFIDTRPMTIEQEGFDSELFEEVSGLFVKNFDAAISNEKIEPSDYMSEEFNPEDVWIGQSYFLMNDMNGNNVSNLRIKYEIIPILNEYIKDGIFKDIEYVRNFIDNLNNRC